MEMVSQSYVKLAEHSKAEKQKRARAEAADTSSIPVAPVSKFRLATVRGFLINSRTVLGDLAMP